MVILWLQSLTDAGQHVIRCRDAQLGLKSQLYTALRDEALRVRGPILANTQKRPGVRGIQQLVRTAAEQVRGLSPSVCVAFSGVVHGGIPRCPQ